MNIRDLYEVCKGHHQFTVAAVIEGKKIYLKRCWYVQDSICYFFPANVMSTYDCYINNITGEGMEDFIVSEAQDKCWYDWENGSTFLDCDFVIANGNCDDFDNIKSEEFYNVYSIKVDGTDILLICDKPKNKKFLVSYAIRGYFDVTVEAETLEEAKEKAEEIEMETEFSNIIDPVAELVDAWEEC